VAAIELENIWKEFMLEREKELTLKERFVNLGRKKKEEKIIALRDVNLIIEKGECFGILGKNGSGKTTLLKIIAGMLKPNRGLVKVDGKMLPILTLGLGFQKELTAKENVYLYGSILGLNKKEIDEKYERIVKFSELEKVMDVKLKDFSDGMIMRLSFSIAFHVESEIIVIDEILAVGDAAFQIKCLERIKQLKEEGKTIVIVLHSTSDIRRFCDRALILESGEIIFSGEASKVCEEYEEIIESERLNRFNGIVMRETGIEFKAFCEKAFVLKTGEKSVLEVKIDQPPKLVELFFQGEKSVRVFSKNLDNDKIIFQTNSLPVHPDEYEVQIKLDGKFLSERPFKVLVKNSKGSQENRIYMLPSSNLPFHDLTLVFGEKAELEAELFEKGKTIFVFKNLGAAFKNSDVRDKGEKNACLFKKNKILLIDNGEKVLDEFNKRVWYDLAIKHFNDTLMATRLGKNLMGIL